MNGLLFLGRHSVLALLVGWMAGFVTAEGANIVPIGDWYPANAAPEKHNVQAIGNRTYYAAGSTGLTIFDITDPNNPVQLGRYDTAGDASAVAIKNNFAFVADGLFEMQIIDITDPAQPFRAAGFYATYRPGGGGYGSNPVVSAFDLVLDGDVVYLADGDSGLQIVDVSDPGNPLLLSYYPTPGSARNVRVAEKIATVNDTKGVRVIDVSDPRSPRLISSSNRTSPPAAWSLALVGNFVYLSMWGDGLDVIDVTVPARPVRVGGIPIDPGSPDVAIDGTMGLVASYSAGAKVVDITDPTNPKTMSTYSTGLNVFGVAIAGTRGYVGARGLHVLDLSDSSHPKLMGSYAAAPFTYRVRVWGNLAFLCKFNDGPLEIVNVSDPAHPALVSSLAGALAMDVALEGNLLFVAMDAGLSIYDITDPGTPVSLWKYVNQKDAYGRGIVIEGHRAFLANGGQGVRVFDVSNPANPTLLGDYDTPAFASGVALSGKLVFVADQEGGLRILEERISTMPHLGLSLSKGISIFEVKGIVGQSYALERVSNLAESWTEVTSFVLQSSLQTIQGETFFGTQGFYRLRVK